MAGNEALKKVVSPSYNAMSRPAMFWNIPIMPMVGLLMGGLLFGIAATFLLSWVWGLVAASPFLIALTALRFVGLIDPQYLRRIRFGRRRLWLNLKYGKPLLLTPFNPQWSKFYGARFSHKRYAPGGESAADGLSGARAHDDPVRQSPGEPDSAQGGISRDPK
ncbi:VirB3 family type IV secretion system protein [Pseudomonas alliivorans]|uniref:VirB3 family type IV secretion system protein n=1 Tax=Pseudomonas cannabina TaxID=86840 RepID=UPI001EE3DD42|nr:VirB3 family type IV secretion system protein [Pseudomonas cannabina]MEE4964445.1 VirB3 family type IV secretion system protein [Pseudomonas alliivorans]MEE4974598.1 VirB3 family type IV secretion system protein [Pseudomonas alliivorans]MEE4979747.1 VirB3 family type IV secretion system protein [Pseudomonas alliivorans]MEE4984870.1 VirB3 family type IV secretion system protein [Pseudomonas alliivorans]MEE5004661.1 VirB3 family type IV secretion system protein [Pseudomonas alliivorans]